MQEGRMMQGMELRLQEEGLNPSASNTERLCLLWKLFMSSENTASSLNQQIQELQKERVKEIDKVQQYVNHIRSLTKTRDSVALGLEQENETLRGTLSDINLQQEEQRREIAEMLLQEGLAEIIPISISEQVAYLLADRASLLEKTLSQEDADLKARPHPDGLQEPTSQRLGENVVKVVKVAPLQAQSPWKKLLGVRKAAQSKQKLTPALDMQCSGESSLKGRTLQELERDVEEASSRLAMAHKEIRRLTDELESAHLTQKAYEPELQEAQVEVEHLRQEVEKLKRCEVAELRKAKEVNIKLEEELCHLRETVQRLQTERQQALEMEGTPDTTSKSKKPQDEDIHKRCREEMEERLSVFQDLTQVTLKLQVEFEMEADLRRRTAQECEEHKRKRTEAEELAQDFQKLCEKQAEDYKTTVGSLQVEIRDLMTKLRDLEVQQVERHCVEHLKQLSSLEDEVSRLKFVLQEEQENSRQLYTDTQEQSERSKILAQSHEVQLQKDAENQRRLTEDLRSVQNILSATKQELQSQREKNKQLHINIIDLEQENRKLQENIKVLENRVSSGQAESESLRTELQQALVSVDAERSKYNDKRIHYKNKLSRAKGLYLRETGWRDNKIKELEKEILILSKQDEKTTDMMKMVACENETLLQKNRDLLSQLHDLEEARKNASDTITSTQMKMNLLEEENTRLHQTTALMSEHIESLKILTETDCYDAPTESRVIEGEDQTTLPT